MVVWLWACMLACGGADGDGATSDSDPVSGSDTDVSSLDTGCDASTLADGYRWLTAEAVANAEDDEGPWDVVVCDPDQPAECLDDEALMIEDSSGDWDGNETFTAFLDAVSPSGDDRYWWIETLVAGPEDLCEVRCCYAVDAWLRDGERPP